MARGRHARIQFQGIRHCSRSTANVAVVSYIISDRKKKKLTTAVPRAVAGRGFFVCFIRDIIRLQQIYGNVVAIQGSGRLRSTLPPHRMMPTRRSPSRLAVESAAARLSAPLGSTTSLAKSKVRRIASTVCASLTDMTGGGGLRLILLSNTNNNLFVLIINNASNSETYKC